jgi:hypothetical protein
MVESVLEEQVECTGGQNGHCKWRNGINFTLERGVLPQDASRLGEEDKDNQRQRYKW